MKNYWVYMLLCSDGSFYVGITGNVNARVFQHNAGADGKKSYTFTRRPVKLIFAALYYDVGGGGLKKSRLSKVILRR